MIGERFLFFVFVLFSFFSLFIIFSFFFLFLFFFFSFCSVAVALFSSLGREEKRNIKSAYLSFSFLFLSRFLFFLPFPRSNQLNPHPETHVPTTSKIGV